MKQSCRRMLRTHLMLSDDEYDYIKLLPNEITAEAARQTIECVRKLRAIRTALMKGYPYNG
jgi:hypothetical protein